VKILCQLYNTVQAAGARGALSSFFRPAIQAGFYLLKIFYAAALDLLSSSERGTYNVTKAVLEINGADTQ
jgi:hypothetical protein